MITSAVWKKGRRLEKGGTSDGCKNSRTYMQNQRAASHSIYRLVEKSCGGGGGMISYL